MQDLGISKIEIAILNRGICNPKKL